MAGIMRVSFNRLTRLIGFIASVVTIVWFSSVAVLAVKRWSAGKEFSLPAWSILVAMVVSAAAGYLLGRRSRQKFRVDKEFDIPFDYAPESPADHGWHVVLQGQQKEQPIFSSEIDGYYGKVLQIRSTKPWYMDYSLGYPDSRSGRVEFVTRPAGNKRALFYVEVELRSKSGSSTERRWLNLNIPNSPVRDVLPNEKCVPAIHNHKPGGWVGIEANIPSLMKMTYSKEGWAFEKILRLRIRNTVRIAGVNLYR